ncbi:unnamed protein product [Phaeothamnion confervicola]
MRRSFFALWKCIFWLHPIVLATIAAAPLDIVFTMVGGLSTSARSLNSYVPEIEQAVRICGSDCRVHMLSNDPTVLNHSAALGLLIGEVKDFSKIGDRFARIYKHQSINPADYERWCFQRWFVILEYFEQLDNVPPVHCIVALDADILLLKSPAGLLRANIPVGVMEDFSASYDLVVRTLGSFMYWSLLGLKSFTNFLTDIYQAPNASFIKAGAIRMPGRLPDEFNSQLIPLKDAEGVMWHWSDMFAVFEFMKEDAKRRFCIAETDKENVIVNVSFPSPGNSIFTVLNGNVHIWRPFNTTVGARENLMPSVASMHFKGDSKIFVDDIVLALLRHGWDPTEHGGRAGIDASIPSLSGGTAVCLSSLGEVAAEEQRALGLCYSLFFFVCGFQGLDAKFVGDFIADHPLMLHVRSDDSGVYGDHEGGQHLQSVYPTDSLRETSSEATCGCNWDGCWYTCPALAETVPATPSNRQRLYESWTQHSSMGNQGSSMFVETDPDLLLQFKNDMFPGVSTGVLVIRHPLCNGDRGSPERWANVWIDFLTRQLPEIAGSVWLVRVEDALREPARIREELHAMLRLPVLLSTFADSTRPLAEETLVTMYKDARANDDCVALREQEQLSVRGNPAPWDGILVARLASAFGYSLDSEEPSGRHSILVFSKTELLAISQGFFAP